MHVCIVGAGLAGLATALSLHAQGHSIVIIEKRNILGPGELDTAISFTPNGYSLLDKLNIDFRKLIDPKTVTFIAALDRNSKILFKGGIKGSVPVGKPQYITSRSELHRLLIDTIKERKAAEIHTGQSVVSIDVSKGICQTASGLHFKADLIVGADGVYSKVRKYISMEDNRIGDFGTARKHRQIALTALVDIEKLTTASNSMKQLLSSKQQSGMIWFYPDVGIDRQDRVALFPTTVAGKRDKIGVFIVFEQQDDELVQQGDNNKIDFTGKYTFKGGIKTETVLALSKYWGKEVLGMISAAGQGVDWVAWQMVDLDLLHTWKKGKAVLVGDAAHAVTPHFGQGVNQGFEDAEALGLLLSRHRFDGSLDSALEDYITLRQRRAHLVQIATRHYASLSPEVGPWFTFNPRSANTFVNFGSGVQGVEKDRLYDFYNTSIASKL